jgi:hypothetical protein
VLLDFDLFHDDDLRATGAARGANVCTISEHQSCLRDDWPEALPVTCDAGGAKHFVTARKVPPEYWTPNQAGAVQPTGSGAFTVRTRGTARADLPQMELYL